MSELLEAAIEYARRGWPVLPLFTWRDGKCACGHDDCPSPGKHPHGKLAPNGLSNATTDVDKVADWWQRFPTANIGLRTGDAFDVLDIDVPGGEEALVHLCEEFGELHVGTWSRTGSGGRHVLFLPTGATNKAGFADHIDWRGQRGYIVAPPSLHYSGNRYEWGTPPGELFAAPEWLRRLVDPPKVEHKAGEYRSLPAAAGDGTPYGLRALEAELAELSRTPHGMRNHELNATTFKLFQLVAGGELNAQVVEDRLLSVAISIGLSERESTQTIASGRKGGMADPRSAPPPMLRLVRVGEEPTGAKAVPNESPAEEPTEPPRQLHIVWIRDVFLDPPPKPPEIIKGMLRKGEMCVIGAPRAVGKTMFGMNMSTLLGRGEGRIAGELEVLRESRVLYSQGELDHWESYARWHRMAGTHGAPPNVAETFDQWRLRVVKRRVSNAGRSQDQSWAESDEFVEAVLDGRVEATIVAQGIDVLVIDPWAVYYSGQENSNDEVEVALTQLRRLSLEYGLSIVAFHHLGKNRDSSSGEPEDLWRGASRLADWASTRITILPHYTAKQASEQNMTRQDARKYMDVFFLRRGEPTPDFSMKMNHRSGWWEPWVGPGRPLAKQSQVDSWETADACSRNGGWKSYRAASIDLGLAPNTAAVRVDRAIAMGWIEEVADSVSGAKYQPSERFYNEPKPSEGPDEKCAISSDELSEHALPLNTENTLSYDPDQEF